MANTSDIKNGLCILLNNDIYTVVEFQHVKPGKGAAFVRTKLKSLTKERQIDHTFNAGAKIHIARIERRPYQFLYKDSAGYTFMHTETFEQLTIEPSLIATPQFLKEGQHVEVVYHDDENVVLKCELPPSVLLRITYTEPGLRGDTATKTLKPATLETGVAVKVPLFINNEDLIKIDTRTGLYIERVNEQKK
ncbi:MAG: elongation factor P [Candidatus Cardinium sp.]|uniref:elongation factor P n=1 Tax=Cardinium endosymbiont of Dermatophagoides farinae TaxID=2597823 RepID=UPI001183223C|nr:elongation factor P [Cardinium endosymbiont of Dermatophagoides farinae]TSJ80584.1 elongation factor P [Cardinium endosymbiont of Dermatophagoides farinae]UWW96572.1 MAG: elongation factor P [Candidatus Cardinium sp.]